MNDSIEPSRRATFRAATKGMRAYTIALKLNAVSNGLNWRGCTKRQLEDEFATPFAMLYHLSGEQLREALK